MHNVDEGYIKFHLDWEKSNIPENLLIEDLIAIRNELYKLNFIGAYINQIGYGNVSKRINNTNVFIISGTQTGNIEMIGSKYFSIVTDVQINNNYVSCQGPVKASSESMSHDAIYKSNSKINSVLHVHHYNLWQYLLFKVDTIPAQIKYGSLEMATYISKIMKGNLRSNKGIFVTEGHQEGIFTYGSSPQEAFDILLDYSKKIG